MAEDVYNEGRLRKYLLGELNEAEQQGLEELLLSEDEVFKVLLIAEDELIDDYLGGALSTHQCSRFDSFFLSTPDRRRKLSFATALRRYVTTEARISEPLITKAAPAMVTPRPTAAGDRSVWRKQALSVRYLKLAAAAVIVLALGLGICRVFFFRSDVAKGMAALAQAYRNERPVEARISGLNYAPLPNTRGAEQSKVDDISLNRAELILLGEVSEHPTSANHHALGRLYLAELKFDKAIAQFEEALRGDANNALLHSDYGAALLEKGKADRLTDDSGKALEELAMSLEHLNTALELDHSLLEALFNRALVHQEMVLPQQAQEDWEALLQKDPNSKWAEEARKNLEVLEERRQKTSRTKEDLLPDFLNAYETHDDERAWNIISRSRDAFSAGKLIRDQLLDAYVEASLRGQNDDASQKLKESSYLGRLELQKTGDTFTSGLAQFYSSSSTRRREALSRARALMKLGQEYLSQARPLEAINAFSRSKQIFAASGDSWEAQYAEQWIAYCYLGAVDTRTSVAILERLARSFEQENHRWLLMRTLHLLSGAEYNLNEYSKAIDDNQRSLALAEKMGDKVGIFNTLSILAEQYRYIGNYRQSLSCIQRSLSVIDSCALNEVQIAQHYGIVASSLASSGFYAGAVDYQKETVRRAPATGNAQLVSRGYVNLGLIYGKMGNYGEGLSAARHAYDAASSLSDQSMRKTMMALSSLETGDLYRESGDINKAVESYDECLEFYKNLDFYYGLYQAHKNRLFCYIAQGNDLAAGEELQTTLGLVEKYRSKILEGDNRNNFSDIEQSVYDLAIDFEYSRKHNSERAFEYSEESRARSLLDMVSGNSRISDKVNSPDIIFDSVSQPLKLSDLQKRIPEQAQIVQYAVLSDKVLIWVISKTAFSTFERKVAQQQLTQKVLDYLRIITSGSGAPPDEANDYAKQLFEILIRPAEPLLDKNRPVYVIPDKVLNYLPFGTLISPDTNRFLVEDYLTVISPSSSLLVICSEMARRKEGKRAERLLSVGNPRFDRSEFPMLADLPSAAREAQEVAGYYGSSCLLTGDGAKETRVQKEMQSSDVIHLAVHLVVDHNSPLRSKLLLAEERTRARSGRSPDGVLEAQEIYGLRLPRTRIVVLSACQSGVERYYGGEGMINLARPFMAAGVPLIVVSLWPVDSDSTAKLMISFHKYRKLNELSTPEALRRAQLEMLNSSEESLRQPYCWASFTAIGGSTSF